MSYSNTTAQEFAACSLDDLGEMLNFDADFFEAFTPANLRAWLSEHESIVQIRGLGDLLTAWARALDDTEAQEWVGFECKMSLRSWLLALSQIASNARNSEIDKPVDGEAGYTDYVANGPARRKAAAEAAAEESRERARRYKAFLEETARANGAADDLSIDVPDDYDPLPQAVAPAPVEEEAPAARQPVSAASFDLEDMPAEDLLEGEEQLAQHKTKAELFLPVARASQLTLPHIIMRSPVIFTGARNVTRKVYTEEAPLRIDRVSGFRAGTIEMKYVGEALFASDLETYAHILRLAATVPLGKRLPAISVLAMLREIGRSKSGSANKALVAQMHRLRKTELRVWTTDETVIASWQASFPDEELFKRGEVKGVQVSFKLLGDLVETKAAETGNTLEFSTDVSRYVRVFFGQRLSSWYSEGTYRELKGDLAKRLYLFYQSHDGTFDFTFDELVEYLGASGDRDTFRGSLEDAHDALQAACFIKGWSLKASSRRNGQKAYVLDGITTKRAARDLEAVDL